MQETSIRPVRQHDLESAGLTYIAGGRYINPATREDLTGFTYACGGSVGVNDGKPRFTVHGEGSKRDVVKESNRAPRVRINMIKQSVGWKWLGESAMKETILVSVESGGKHFYALRADFKGAVTLSTFPNSPTEPRLRPTTRGLLSFSDIVGHIVMRGREHPVYAVITVGLSG